MSTDAGDNCIVLGACVLIDYLKEDSIVLESAGQHIGSIVVPSPVISSLEQSTQNYCENLGVRAITPDLRLIQKAATRSGGLSCNDWLCILLAQDLKATLYSSEKPLLNMAFKAGVEARRGLELLLELVRAGVMSPNSAEEVAARICSRSSRYASALEEFQTAL